MASPKVKKRYGSKRPAAAAGDIALKQADDIEEGLVGVWEWVRKYRYVIIGVLGGLFVITAVAQFWTTRSQASARETAGRLNEALGVYGAPVVAAGEDTEGLPEGIKTFPTRTARAAAVEDKLGKFASEASGKPAELAQLAVAAARFEKGDHAAALAAIDAYLGANADSPLSAALGLQRAAALSAQGKRGDAASALEAWGQGGDWWFQAWSALSRGDLAESPEQAEAAYRQGLAAFGDEEPPTPAAKFVKFELERRLAR